MKAPKPSVPTTTGVTQAAKLFTETADTHEALLTASEKLDNEIAALQSFQWDMPAALMYYGLDDIAYNRLHVSRIMLRDLKLKQEEKEAAEIGILQSKSNVLQARHTLRKAKDIILDRKIAECNLSELPVFLQKNLDVLQNIQSYNAAVDKIVVNQMTAPSKKKAAIQEQRNRLERLFRAQFKKKMFHLKRKEYEVSQKVTEAFIAKLNSAELKQKIKFN